MSNETYDTDSLDNLRDYLNNDFFELIEADMNSADSQAQFDKLAVARLRELFLVLFLCGLITEKTLNKSSVVFRADSRDGE